MQRWKVGLLSLPRPPLLPTRVQSLPCPHFTIPCGPPLPPMSSLLPPPASARLLGLQAQCTHSCPEAPAEEAGKQLCKDRSGVGAEATGEVQGPSLSKKSLQGNRQHSPESPLMTGAKGPLGGVNSQAPMCDRAVQGPCRDGNSFK